MKKTDFKVLFLLSIIFLFLVFIYIGSGNIYGSMTDWIIQHTVFPDYFRMLFYDTGNITPNLALHIGAGQNIYYFSYYGLLNPLILASYFLPFVKMADYIIVINILIVIVSSFLVYKWLMNNQYHFKISLVSALLFMLLNAFFHAHRHIMFVDYIPFLILGLIGIDKYFKDGKSYLYIISVFLMIMTSYYYSVGGLLCLLMYGIYKYIKINDKISIKGFFKDGIKFLIPMFIGVLMSFILIVPTIYAIISSRSQVKDLIDLSTLLIPRFNFDALLYDNYALGFTAISLVALVYVMFYTKREKRFLGTSVFLILTVPFFMYILNGMLYLRGKVFIPLSPLIILVVSIFLESLHKKKINFITLVVIVVISLLMSSIFGYQEKLFYMDLFLTVFIVVGYLYKRKEMYLYIPLIIIALGFNIAVNRSDNYVEKDFYDELQSPNISNLLTGLTENDTSLYRMDNIKGNTSLSANKIYNSKYYQTSVYSSTYNNFYKTFNDDFINNAIVHRNKLMMTSSNNIMFQTIMGTKYLLSDNNNVPVGYELVVSDNENTIYKNDYVLPVGYSSSSILSYNTIDQLDYPYRTEALLKNIVVNDSGISNFTSNIQKINLEYYIESALNVESIDDKYIIKTDREESIKLHLREPLINKVLFIKFKVIKASNCRDGDLSVTINNITNKLTCKQWLYFNNNYEFEYAISNVNGISQLDITFSKGYFEITDIDTFVMDYENIKDSVIKVDKFLIDKSNTNGNVISGNIDVKENGYFLITIPYDKGFTVYLDKEKIDYEMVNKAFIGFPISSGNHHIRLEYKSPGYDIGLFGSAIGLISYLGILFSQKRSKF